MTRVAVALLIGCLVLGLLLLAQRAEVEALKGQLGMADLRAELEAATAAEWYAVSVDRLVALSTCQQQWSDAQERGDTALQLAERARQALHRELEAWRTVWDARPSTCEAALAALDDACPALEGY